MLAHLHSFAPLPPTTQGPEYQMVSVMHIYLFVYLSNYLFRYLTIYLFIYLSSC